MLDPNYFNSLSEEMHKFAADQMSLWPLARNNYRELKKADTRDIRAGVLNARLIFIPSRAISTNARTDAESLSRRPCFLCAANRPKEQRVQEFEGAKNKRYNIQINPYPILPVHFVIPSVEHMPQSIWHRYVDMLRLAKRRPGFTIIYNGPHSGASAPDHFHFQAIPSGMLPLELSVREGENLQFVAKSNDVSLYQYRGYVNGVFVLRGPSSKSMNRMFYRLLDCADVVSGDSEPRFNLYSFRIGAEYCTIVVFRTSHRSSHYFTDDAGKHLWMSPGCVDMAGLFVTIDREDFRKLDESLLMEMLGEITIDADAHQRIIWRLTRTQPRLEVEIASGGELEFEMLTDGAGKRKAVLEQGRIDYGGNLYDELFFEEKNPSTMFAEPSFIIYGNEAAEYAGCLRIVVENGRLVARNIIGKVDYLRSRMPRSAETDAYLDANWDRVLEDEIL